MAKKLGYKLNSFYLTPTGFSLNFQSGIFENNDEIKIAFAGPFFNIFFSIIITAFWWVFPQVYSYTYDLVFQSLCLGFLNLLPAFPLDGGRIAACFFSSFFNKVKVLRILKINNIIFSIIFFILFVVSCFTNYNPTLILMVVFLLGGIMDTKKEAKYEKLYFFKKKIKNITKARVFYVSSNSVLSELLKMIERSKYTLFYVQLRSGKYKILPEDAVVNLSLSFDVDKKIEDIFIEVWSKKQG